MINWNEIRKHGYCGPDDPAPDAPHLTFTHCSGDAIADHQAENEASLLSAMNIYTSSEIVIWAAKCLIAEGKLRWDRVVFVAGGLYLMTNEYGAANEWPIDLFATINVLSERALLAQTRKRKEKQNGL